MGYIKFRFLLFLLDLLKIMTQAKPTTAKGVTCKYPVTLQHYPYLPHNSHSRILYGYLLEIKLWKHVLFDNWKERLAWFWKRARPTSKRKTNKKKRGGKMLRQNLISVNEYCQVIPCQYTRRGNFLEQDHVGHSILPDRNHQNAEKNHKSEITCVITDNDVASKVLTFFCEGNGTKGLSPSCNIITTSRKCLCKVCNFCLIRRV